MDGLVSVSRWVRPGGGSFATAADLLSHRCRPWKKGASTEGACGHVPMIDAWGRISMDERDDGGWRHFKDAKAQAAVVLRTLILAPGVDPDLAAEAARSLAFTASGSLTDFHPMDFDEEDHRLVAVDLPFGPLAVEVPPPVCLSADLAAIIMRANAAERMMGHSMADLPLTADGRTVSRHDGFAVGDVVRVDGYDGDYRIDAILVEECGYPLHQPFRLVSVWRDESEGYPTAYGTLTPASDGDRRILLWAAACEITPAPVDDCSIAEQIFRP